MSKNKKKGGGIGSVITTLVLIAAIAVFCYAAWTLYGYYREYKAGTDEYSKLENAFTSMEDGQSDGESADGSSGAAAEMEAVTESMSEGGAAAGDGAADAASASGGVYEPEQHGETGKSGIVLKRVEDLEDPDTLEEKVEQAAAVDTEENREKKRLPLMRNPIDFAQLQEINPEIIGWIRIGALDKSYPVAQAKIRLFMPTAREKIPLLITQQARIRCRFQAEPSARRRWQTAIKIWYSLLASEASH